jgi:hypothetical protein
MFIDVLQAAHKQQRLAEALAARMAQADEKAWKPYIRALEK